MKKRTVPTTTKLMTALKNLPYVTPFHASSAMFCTFAASKAGFKRSGVMISLTNEVMIAPKSSSDDHTDSKVNDVATE